MLPRLLWPLMLYEIATSNVEGFERLINRHLRRWLGLPPSFTSIGLYGRTNQLKLPMTSIVEEFKVAKGRLVVTLKQKAESRLRHKDIVGTTAVGRQELGITKPQRWISSSNKERGQMVQQEISLTEEEDRQSRAVGMGGQCAWTR